MTSGSRWVACAVAAIVVTVLGVAACSGGVPRSPPQDECASAATCQSPAACELAAGATCASGKCLYPAKRCEAPPAPECTSNDGVYRTYAAIGVCQADGSCLYASTDTPCAGCSTNCLGSCTGITCPDKGGGCQVNGRCVPGIPPTCVYDNAPSTTACDDGVACTYNDHCDGAGSCALGTPITCTDDPPPCGGHKSCNGTSTCAVTYPGTTTLCSDGNACTYSDHCNGAGACVGTSYTCTAAAACATSTCDGAGGCIAGLASAGTSCGSTQCTTSSCDGAGNCNTSNKPNGTACGATTCDKCSSGICVGCLNGTHCCNPGCYVTCP